MPSDLTTTSFGELNRRPEIRSTSTVRVPSCSVRVTQRVWCSHDTRRPSRSTVWPLVLWQGERNTETEPSVSSHRIMRLFGMSDHTR